MMMRQQQRCILVLLVLLAVAASSSSTVEAAVTALVSGRIEACAGRLPDLKAFLKGGEAESYRNVHISYVRGTRTVLRVYGADGRETAAVALSTIRTKEGMHAVMVDHGFVRKSDAERQADRDAAQRVRRQRNAAMFFRSEYVRKRSLHVHLFREHVMRLGKDSDNAATAKSWVYADRDYLLENYDKIFRNEAIYKDQLRDYAARYLARVSGGGV